MSEIKELFTDVLNEDFISAVISNPKNKNGISKIKVRPILKKENLLGAPSVRKVPQGVALVSKLNN